MADQSTTDDATPSTGTLDLETWEFKIPSKEIACISDVQTKWEKSEAYRDLVGFLIAMNEAIKNKKLRDQYPVSEEVKRLVEMLDTLYTWVEEFPPIDQPQRFGNKAFKTWFEKLKEEGEKLLTVALGDKYIRAVPEVFVYLKESVGNSVRIDYGTGHEMSFAAFLCCLFKIGALKQEDSVAVIFKIFNRYIELTRHLQLTYRMEPAGSQGVWSLDDYQFLPFLWGSAQLLDHKRIHPKSFPDEDICISFSKDYMFLAAISYIHKVKTGPFAEHSNQLWNISGVQQWSKVNSGLIKMYKAEVLAKFPVIQHFLFGSLMSIKAT